MTQPVHSRRSLPADFIRDAVRLYSDKGDVFLRDLRENPHTIGIFLSQWCQHTISPQHVEDCIISQKTDQLLTEVRLVNEKRRLFERWQAWSRES